MRYRIKVVTQNNNVHYGQYEDFSVAQREQLISGIFNNIERLDNIHVDDNNGNTVYIRGDQIESLTLEKEVS